MNNKVETTINVIDNSVRIMRVNGEHNEKDDLFKK